MLVFGGVSPKKKARYVFRTHNILSKPKLLGYGFRKPSFRGSRVPFFSTKHPGENWPALRIMGSQSWWFGDPRPLLYTSKPLYSRVQWFLGCIFFVWGFLFVMILDAIGRQNQFATENWCGNASSEAASFITASQELHFQKPWTYDSQSGQFPFQNTGFKVRA